MFVIQSLFAKQGNPRNWSFNKTQAGPVDQLLDEGFFPKVSNKKTRALVIIYFISPFVKPKTRLPCNRIYGRRRPQRLLRSLRKWSARENRQVGLPKACKGLRRSSSTRHLPLRPETREDHATGTLTSSNLSTLAS